MMLVHSFTCLIAAPVLISEKKKLMKTISSKFKLIKKSCSVLMGSPQPHIVTSDMDNLSWIHGLVLLMSACHADCMLPVFID